MKQQESLSDSEATGNYFQYSNSRGKGSFSRIDTFDRYDNNRPSSALARTGTQSEVSHTNHDNNNNNNNNNVNNSGYRDRSERYNTYASDEEYDKTNQYLLDEFGANTNDAGNKILRTGRQRKKLAARSKGGEFQSRRKKRRVYFCCVSSEIDVQKLYDYLVGAGGLLHGWKYQLHGGVLHLFKGGVSENNIPVSNTGNPATSGRPSSPIAVRSGITFNGNLNNSSSLIEEYELPSSASSDIYSIRNPININKDLVPSNDNVLSDSKNSPRPIVMSSGKADQQPGEMYDEWIDSLKISNIGAQEVFIFDFGSVVFWNFSRGEETNLLKTIRMFVTKGLVGANEFKSGQDDMAFVTSPEIDVIQIANDVITLPEDTQVKQRLSVSFAISQSSVLAIFEARIERKVNEYKYIPETLASSGKVNLSERQLGIMIGEVFVIRLATYTSKLMHPTYLLTIYLGMMLTYTLKFLIHLIFFGKMKNVNKIIN